MEQRITAYLVLLPANAADGRSAEFSGFCGKVREMLRSCGDAAGFAGQQRSVLQAQQGVCSVSRQTRGETGEC
jgi:hypothetical protein